MKVKSLWSLKMTQDPSVLSRLWDLTGPFSQTP